MIHILRLVYIERAIIKLCMLLKLGRNRVKAWHSIRGASFDMKVLLLTAERGSRFRHEGVLYIDLFLR